MNNLLDITRLSHSKGRTSKSSDAALGRELLKADKVDISLRPKETFRLEGDRRGAHIHALAGELWVTQGGDAKDYLLSPGDTFEIKKDGLVLIQGLKAARFRLCLVN